MEAKPILRMRPFPGRYTKITVKKNVHVTMSPGTASGPAAAST